MNTNFLPVQTILIALTGSSAVSVGISPSSGARMQAVELTNISTNTVFGEFFPTSTGVVTAPTTSASAGGFVLGPNARNVRYVCPPIAYVSAVTTGATLTAVVSVTAGQFL